MAEAILQPFIDTPINLLLVPPIAYYIYSLAFPDTSVRSGITEWREGYSWRPAQHPPTVLFKRYSPKTLAPFDGKDGARILLAIKGTVFDVSAGRGFYGPGKSDKKGSKTLLILYIGGSYGNFAGRDASRGMAKQSFDDGKII